MILIICFGLYSLSMWSAVPTSMPQQAQQLFEQQLYNQAGDLYRQLLKRQSDNPLYLYRYARCLQEQGNNADAIRYFESAGEKYPLRNFYLGELYAQDYRFQEAINAYQRYLEKTDTTNERYAIVLNKIEHAQKALRYLNRVENIQIIDSVILPKKAFLRAYHLSKSAGTITFNDAFCDYTNERQDTKITTTTDYTLLTCQRLLEGEWLCDTLRIPSFYNSHCNYPYMLSDGVTVYFASDNESGLGGYDIYITQYSTNTNMYLPPENMGMPYNSPANDYMLVVDDIRGVGFFASDRYMTDDQVCVYTFIPNEEKQILRDTTEEYIRHFAQGKVLQPKQEKKKTTPPVFDNKSNTKVTMKPFVMNDSVVYYKMSDFKSIDARVLYEEYLQQEEQVQEMKKTIEDKRATYHHATTEARNTLGEELLQLETEYLSRKQKLSAMLLKVHQLEQ